MKRRLNRSKRSVCASQQTGSDALVEIMEKKGGKNDDTGIQYTTDPPLPFLM